MAEQTPLGVYIIISNVEFGECIYWSINKIPTSVRACVRASLCVCVCETAARLRSIYIYTYVRIVCECASCVRCECVRVQTDTEHDIIIPART